jgi:RimJ/RimL family protein N-acetyltransferase
VREPPPIATPRLNLVALPPVAIQRLLEHDRPNAEAAVAGITLPDEFPTPDERAGFLPIQLERMRREPAERAWMARLMIDRATNAAIGHCGFHGPPRTIGRAEIGYTVFGAHRNRGYAKEAAAALTRWAFQQGQREVYATVSPGNGPSLHVVRALGFTQVGEQMDEVDGPELVFVLRREENP